MSFIIIFWGGDNEVKDENYSIWDNGIKDESYFIWVRSKKWVL